jgi:3,4-dihydroxy 2-butanone 4-phosphate synthase/GTP cyclohydrolase II
VLVYLHQTSPGIGLQRDEEGIGHLVAHPRELPGAAEPHGKRLLQHEVGIGAQILVDLGLRRIRLLTNHPRKIVALEAFGIEITGQVAVPLD